jgi:hypothetical protein
MMHRPKSSWKAWLRLGIVVLISVSLAALAGKLAGRAVFRHEPPGRAPEPEQPALSIDPTSLDFGEVWADGPEHVLRFPVRNNSSRTVYVGGILTGCNCRPVEPQTFALQPGETRAVRLTITDLNRPEYVGRARPIRIELRPVLAGKPADTWTAHGVVRPRIETDVPAVMFGEANRVGQPPVARTITVTLPRAGELSAKLVPEVAAVEVKPGAPANSWRVTVAPHTQRQPGPFRATLTLTSTPPGGAPETLDLPVEGVLLEGER